jgi:hypothetical protein
VAVAARPITVRPVFTTVVAVFRVASDETLAVAEADDVAELAVEPVPDVVVTEGLAVEAELVVPVGEADGVLDGAVVGVLGGDAVAEALVVPIGGTIGPLGALSLSPSAMSAIAHVVTAGSVPATSVTAARA